MQLSQQEVKQFQEKITTWYADNKRDFPRRDTFDPYKVLVSETMSQQTQVDRVVPKFLVWMNQLPTLSSLAEVGKPILLGLRSGLGFNSRAIRLQQCAQELVTVYDSEIPQDREKLRKLPGIGPYTSASLLAFAYNIEVPVVDTNIRRVLIWELGLEEDLSAKELEDIASQCIPSGKSNDRHNALMDYGALVTTSKATGIKPTSKQSKFQGSARQVRGNILKYLLKHIESTEQDLRELFPHEQFDTVLMGMVRDEIIGINDDIISIA